MRRDGDCRNLFAGYEKEGASHAWNNFSCGFDSCACGRAAAMGRRLANSKNGRERKDRHEVKGKVEERIGRVTNNPNLEAEGQGEQVGGKIRKKIGQVEKVVGL